MKKILFLSVVIALVLIPYQGSKAAVKDYDYELITQSPYPATLAPGEVTNVWIEVKNTGTKTWWDYQDPAYAYHPVRLGTGSQYGETGQQQDYTSEVANSDWIAPNRVADTSPNVTRPGWHTRFQFNIKAPATPGVYMVYFTPLVEGITWMKDIGIRWDITVYSGAQPQTPAQPQMPAPNTLTTVSYSYDLVSQIPNSALTLTPNSTTDVSIKIKNTGLATWSNTGANKIVLDWGSIYDNSVSQINGFASGGTDLAMTQSSVATGETGEFKFQIKAPAVAGNYKAYFTPTVQGIAPQPLKDIGIYWEINVSGAATTQTPMVPINLKVEQCVNTPSIFCIVWGSEVRYVANGVVQPINDLYRSTNENSGFSLVYSGTSNGYQDSNIVAGTTYYYKVRSHYSDSGYSDYTPVVSGSIFAVPNTPTNLRTTNTTNSSINLAWDVAVNAASYELYRDSVPSTQEILVYSGNNNSYLDTSNIVSGSTYIYKVRAKNGSQFSSYTAVIYAVARVESELKLATPILRITNVTDQVSFSWDPISYATGYSIVRSDSLNGTYVTLNNNYVGTSYTDGGSGQLQLGKTYYYKVLAFDATTGGRFASDYSTPVSATINLPAVPTGLSVNNATANSLTISWNISSGASNYQLWRSMSDPNGTYSAIYAGTNTFYTDNQMIYSGITYYYKIRAINGAGVSDLSSIVSRTAQ